MIIYSKHTVFSKIASEGYCCMAGYLRLCRARGEAVPSMADWIGMHRYTLYNHYRKLAAGKYPCQKKAECLEPVILDLEKK